MFSQRYDRKPDINGAKDGAIFKHLLAQRGYDEVADLLKRFFDSEDEFILRAGHSVGVFKSVLNKLIAQAANPTQSFGTDVSGLVRFAQKGSDGLAGPKALRD